MFGRARLKAARTSDQRLSSTCSVPIWPTVQNLFPKAELVKLESPRAFVRGELPEVDAVVFSAEWGAAWTLLYPHSTIVVPEGMKIVVPNGIALPLNDMELKRFIDTWLDLKRDTGLLDALFDYWILGKSAEEPEPRWSILRNVLNVEVDEEDAVDAEDEARQSEETGQ